MDTPAAAATWRMLARREAPAPLTVDDRSRTRPL
jgi:hypothetical protein